MSDLELPVLLDRIRTTPFEQDEQTLQKVCDEMTSLWEQGIERISDTDLKEAVKFYYGCIIPEEFFVAPASTSGKHPHWHNRPGGIIRHLTECCLKADRALKGAGYVDKNDRVDPLARDIVLAATMITDTFKNGSPWEKSTVKNHGEIAAFWWRHTAKNRVDDGISEQIANAVHYHYGRYTPVPKGDKQIVLADLPRLTQIVHRLDMDSSDFCNELLCGPVDKILSQE